MAAAAVVATALASPASADTSVICLDIPSFYSTYPQHVSTQAMKLCVPWPGTTN